LDALVYRLSPDSVFEGFDDGGLILNLKDLTLTELNLTAKDILQLTDGVRSVGLIARQIAEEYEVSQEEALQDVKELYLTLFGQGSVEIMHLKEMKEG